MVQGHGFHGSSLPRTSLPCPRMAIAESGHRSGPAWSSGQCRLACWRVDPGFGVPAAGASGSVTMPADAFRRASR